MRLRQALAWPDDEFRELAAHLGLVHAVAPHPRAILFYALLWLVARRLQLRLAACHSHGDRDGVGDTGELRHHHRALPGGHHLARLLRRLGAQLGHGHPCDGAGLLPGPRAARLGQRRDRRRVRGADDLDHPRRPCAEHPDAALAAGSSADMAGAAAEARRLALAGRMQRSVKAGSVPRDASVQADRNSPARLYTSRSDRGHSPSAPLQQNVG